MRRVLAVLFSVCMLPGLFCPPRRTVLIRDRAGLKAIAEAPRGSYALVADIDLEGEPWIPFAFSGTLMGNGHTVENMRVEACGKETRQTVDGNYIAYDTSFGGLFSVAENAVITGVRLKNAILETETEQSCFIAGLAGYASGCTLTDCDVSGRFTLYVNNGVNVGAGGLVGFMDSCTVENCSADTELIVADRNTALPCEEFAGGICAIGRGKIRNCTVKTRIWASAHGCVHNGGAVGMAFWLHKGDGYKQYLCDTVSDTEITFFEDGKNRHGYSDAFIGENLGSVCRMSRNKKTHFISTKVRTFDQILLPPEPYVKR